MLSTPQNGWTTLTIKDSVIPDISYTCYPHLLMCEAFVRYLSYGMGEAGVAVFDLEGDFALVVLSDCGITVVYNGESITYDVSILEVHELVDEFLEDLEKDFDLWIDWFAPDSVEDEDFYRRNLLEHIEVLKGLVA